MRIKSACASGSDHADDICLEYSIELTHGDAVAIVELEIWNRSVNLGHG